MQEIDDSELILTLSDIFSIIKSSDCDNILILGDLNCDLSRNTTFVNKIKSFIADNSLRFFWESENIDAVDYTFSHFVSNTATYSVIDHFVSNQRVIDAITEAGVVHQGQNPSNRSPIYAKISVGGLNLGLEEAKYKKRTNWEAASNEARERFIKDLASTLNHLEVTTCTTCQNLKCGEHSEDVEKYALNVLEAVESCTQNCHAIVGGGGGVMVMVVVAEVVENIRESQDGLSM